MWKACGNTCIDGTLYMFVSRHEVDAFCDPVKKDNSKLQTAENSSLIVSTDKGCTWRRTAKENYDSPMFPGRRFGSPFFVKYGRDGKTDVHRADEFVYAVANDGYWENGNDMVLARVRRDRIASLNPADWQFHLGGDGLADASWSQHRNRAQPMIARPGKCSMTGVPVLRAAAAIHHDPVALHQGLRARGPRGDRVGVPQGAGAVGPVAGVRHATFP